METRNKGPGTKETRENKEQGQRGTSPENCNFLQQILKLKKNEEKRKGLFKAQIQGIT